MLKSITKITRWVLLCILLLLTSLYILLQAPHVQQWLAGKISSTLSKEWKTRVELRHLSYSFFNRVSLDGLLIQDRQQDTIAYIGSLQIRISDLLKATDPIELNDLVLDHTVLKLQRQDSIWRYQFLVDYFSQPTADTTSPEKKPARINLRSVTVHDLKISQTDEWSGSALLASLESLKLTADRLLFSEKNFRIRTLALDKPIVNWRYFPGKKPATSIAKKEETSTDEWNLDNKSLLVGSLTIRDGSYRMDQTDAKAKEGFDPKHIYVSHIDASLRNSTILGDTVFSEMEISARERSGFSIRKFKGDLRFSPNGIKLSNYKLETNGSLVQKELTLSYKKLSDWEHFADRVQIEAEFENSVISSNDLSFFIPSLKNWNRNITLAANIKGTVNELTASHLSLGAGAETSLQGSVLIKGISNWETAFIDFEAKRLSSSYEDLAFLIPSLKKLNSPDLSRLRYLRFNGRFTGGFSNFAAKGSLQTGLGTLRSDIAVKLPKNAMASYEGGLEVISFNAGELVQNKDLGLLNFSGRIEGKGFDQTNSTASFNGTIGSIDFRGYRYEHITINGSVHDNRLEAFTSIENEHLQTGTLETLVNWREKEPTITVNGTLEKATLRELRLTKDDIRISGKLDLSIKGLDPASITGKLAFREATVMNGEEALPMDSLILQVQKDGDNRSIRAQSNEFNVMAEGRFNWLTLPDAVQYLLHQYYPSLVKEPEQYPRDTRLRFEINTYLAEPFLRWWKPGMSGLNNSHIAGKLDFGNKQYELNVVIPQLHYENYGLDSIDITAKGFGSTLQFDGHAAAVQLNGKLRLPPVSLKLNISRDSTQVSLRSEKVSTVEKVNLNALIKTYADGLEIQFDPSDFTLNGKSWTLNEEGGLTLRKGQPVSGSLLLSEGEQQIRVQSADRDAASKDQINVVLENLNLNDIAPFILPDNRLEGLISGSLTIKDPVGKFEIDAKQIRTSQLRLDNDSIGELTTGLHYDRTNHVLTATGNTLNQENYLGYQLLLDFADSLGKKNLIALQAKTYPIKILERFLGDLFSDISGYLTGDVTISGDLNRPGVSGKGTLKDAGLRVNYTQCYYRIEDREVELTTSKIDLDGLVLRDTITGNPVYVSGGIDHESFFNMFYDLDISTRKPGTRGQQDNRPVQLLRTTSKDNSLFYGDVKGTAVLQLRGPQSDMAMTLNATSSERDSSHITLPPSSSRESGIADFLVERKYGKEMNEEESRSNGDNLLFDIELTATPLLQVKVVLDDLTEDEIKGSGSGTIKIRSGTTEPLSLRGRFNIEQGDYLFTFQSFFKKPFEIRKGINNYIEWTGDPYDANIKFEAMYRSERVSFAPLASTLNLTSNVSNARSDVYVVARLTEKLFQPNISFYLDFPANSIANSNPELGLLLRQMQQNVNELNRQVTYLIVFNSFAPNELGGSLAGAGVNVSTISGMLLSVLSDQINKLFSNLLKSDKYHINLNTSLYNRNLLASSSTALNLGSNVNFSIGRSFLDNRFVISTGLGMDAPLGLGSSSASVQQSILLLPDVTMEWLVNPTGTIRASFFYRTNTDYLTASSNSTAIRSRRAGVSLSLKRESDRLFGRNRSGSKKQ